MKTRTFMTAATLAFAFGALTMLGCSSSTPPPPEGTTQLELTFDLSKCQQLEAGLFKCPAADKPICSPDYNGSQAAQCVRIGHKGSVFVSSPGNQ
ncbi:MAG: hypothetical protein WA854_11865 [Candidatus Binataceae bacterium]